MSLRPKPQTPVGAPVARRTRLDDVLAAGTERASLAQRKSAPTDAPAAPLDMLRVANRGDPKHVRAIAVLAYTNLWNTFINWHLRGRTHDFDAQQLGDNARLYAGVFAFFAPISDLMRDVEAVKSAASISLVLPDAPGPWRYNRPACRPRLFINGSEVADPSGKLWEEHFADIFIEPAARGLPDPRRTWRATLSRLALELDRATATLGAGSRRLYRGMSNMDMYERPPASSGERPPFADFRMQFNQFATVYTSTTSQLNAAERFTANTPNLRTQEDQRFQVSWLLVLTIHPGVRYIDVHKILPEHWRCFTTEQEMLIAPGAFYMLPSGFVIDRTERPMKLYVNVWGTHPDIPQTVVRAPPNGDVDPPPPPIPQGYRPAPAPAPAPAPMPVPLVPMAAELEEEEGEGEQSEGESDWS